MNVDMLFQTVATMTSSAKTGNNQSLSDLVSNQQSSSSNTQQDSFKSEMDKAFDRKNNSTKSFSNDDKDKVQKQDQPKQEPEKPEVDNDSSKQQELAAAQMQNPVQPLVDDKNLLALVTENVAQVAGNEPVQVLTGQSIQKQGEGLLKMTSQAVETSEDQSVLLPFQSRIDMVKSAMLKEATQQQNPQQTTNQGQVTGMTQETVETETSPKASDLDQLLSEKQTDTEENTAPELPIMAKPETLDLSKVNIKVAEAPIDTTKSNFAEQMADKIIYKMDEGKQEFDLQLNPKELGKLNIKLTFENGSAQVLITCSNNKAQSLMATLSDNIRGILEANTGVNSTIHLQQEDMLQGQYNQDTTNREGSANQHSRQQEDKGQATEDLSFIDKLRLGLIDGLEVAV